MPLFDYRCEDCSKRFTMMVGVVAEGRELACPACKSERLTKLVSRFGSPRSEDQVLDDLADLDKVGDVDDPRVLKKWMREMSKTMDEDVGDDLEELMEMEAEEDDAGSGPSAPNEIY